MSDGVPGAPDIAEPYVIALVKEHRGQERLFFVAILSVKPSVRVHREAVQKEHDAPGPLVRDLLFPCFAQDSEHGELVSVLGCAIIGRPVKFRFLFLESLFDLWIVFPVSLAGSGFGQLLGSEERERDKHSEEHLLT